VKLAQGERDNRVPQDPAMTAAWPSPRRCLRRSGGPFI